MALIPKNMEVTSIVAYAGLILGFLNIGILIYKEFLIKGKLDVLDHEFLIRMESRYPDAYDVQINLRLYAKKDNIHIKKILLMNSNDFTNRDHKNLREIELFRAIQYGKIDFSKISFKNYPEIIKETYDQQSFNLIDMKIEKKSMKSISFNDRLSGVREMDGWELLPENGWKLKVFYDKTDLVKLLTPKIIR